LTDSPPSVIKLSQPNTLTKNLTFFIQNKVSIFLTDSFPSVIKDFSTKHFDKKPYFFFDRFDDVWYTVFFQFWNEYFAHFSQRYYQQNYLIFIDSKWIPKRIFFIRYTLEENKINKSFKIEKKRYTKHHQIDQIFMFFDRFDDVWYAVLFQFWNVYLSYFPRGHSV